MSETTNDWECGRLDIGGSEYVIFPIRHQTELLLVSTLGAGTRRLEEEHSPLPRSFTKAYSNKEVTAR